MLKLRFIEVFGWYGTIVIVIAHVSVSFSSLSSDSISYQLLNLTGAAGVVMVSIYKSLTAWGIKYYLDNNGPGSNNKKPALSKSYIP